METDVWKLIELNNTRSELCIKTWFGISAKESSKAVKKKLPGVVPKQSQKDVKLQFHTMVINLES